MLLGFDAGQVAWIAATALVAFVVRGMSGFGSSMLGIGSLTILLPPVQVVPAFLALEMLTTLHLLPSVWRQVDWRSLRWVVAGSLLATPLGVALLARLDPNPMRLVVSLLLVGLALVMPTGLAQRLAPQAPGRWTALGAGAASGVLNGMAGIGGPPAIVFYFATTAAAVGRASLIAYFLVIDLGALAWSASQGLLLRTGAPLVIVALPFALLGIWLGQRLYRRLDEPQLRRLVWTLLGVIGAVGAASALRQMLA